MTKINIATHFSKQKPSNKFAQRNEKEHTEATATHTAMNRFGNPPTQTASKSPWYGQPHPQALLLFPSVEPEVRVSHWHAVWWQNVLVLLVHCSSWCVLPLTHSHHGSGTAGELVAYRPVRVLCGSYWQQGPDNWQHQALIFMTQETHQVAFVWAITHSACTR